MSLSYSQCRAAVDGFVARLHSIIHPAGVQPLRRTHGAERRTHSPADGTFKRFRTGLRSSSWLRLLFLKSSAGISAGIRDLCGRPHCKQLLLAPPRQRHIRRIRLLEHRHHQDRERPRHRGYGLAFRYLRAPCAHPQSLGLEVGVGRAVAQDHLRAFDKKPPHERGARLRYVALPVDVPGLVLPRREAEPRPHVSRLPEPVHVPARHRDEPGRDVQPDVADLHEPSDLRLERRGLGEPADLPLVGLDRDRRLSEVLHRRPCDVAELPRPRRRVEPVEAPGRAFRDPEAHGLGDRAHLHDDARAMLHEEVAHLVEIGHPLAPGSAQLHRMEKPRVGEREPRQHPRVVDVVLRLRLRCHPEAAGGGHVHLEPRPLGGLVHPSAVHPRLERHRRRPVLRREELRKPLLCRRNHRLHGDLRRLPVLGHDADLCLSVAHVHADCGIMRVVHFDPPVCLCFCTATVASAFQIALHRIGGSFALGERLVDMPTRAALHGASARVGMFASRFPSSRLSKNASFPTVEKRLVLHHTSAASAGDEFPTLWTRRSASLPQMRNLCAQEVMID